MRDRIDMSGRKIGCITVIEPTVSGNHNRKYFCVCECGRISMKQGNKLRDLESDPPKCNASRPDMCEITRRSKSCPDVVTLQDYQRQKDTCDSVPCQEQCKTDPQHYQLDNGTQVIDLTETLDFCSGNVVKYVARAGKKDGESRLDDLLKAAWYLDRLIDKAGTPF